MLLFALFALLVFQPAHAAPTYWDEKDFTPQQWDEMRKALAPASEAAAFAAESLAPCEGLDHLSNAVFKNEPPRKLCPIAFEGYQQMQRFDRHLRDNCRELTTWAGINLRVGARAANDPAFMAKAKKELMNLHRSAQGIVLNDEGEAEPSPEFGVNLSDDFGTKESADARCLSAVSLVLLYRKRALSIAQEHYKQADSALDALAERPAAEDYFHFLRYGNARER